MDHCLPSDSPASRTTLADPSMAARGAARRPASPPARRRIAQAVARHAALAVLLALSIGPHAATAADGGGSTAGSASAVPPAGVAGSPAVDAEDAEHARIVVQPGRVVGVLDGDTLDLLTPRRRTIRVRLSGIDAPERRQAYGQVARERLADRVFGQDVRVELLKSDRWGRRVGRVIDGEGDVNLAMIEGGWAWHFERYAHEQPAAERRAYAAAQRRARERGNGLWADPHATAPWDWRAAQAQRSGDRPAARSH